MSEMLINESITRDTELRENAIKIAIRYHFCDDEEEELVIYETLSEWEDDSDFPYVVWEPFENMSPSELFDNIDNLVEDIIKTLK